MPIRENQRMLFVSLFVPSGDAVGDIASRNGSTAVNSAVTLFLTEEEAAVARWAIGEWTATFTEVVVKGYLRRLPPAPALNDRTLQVPLHLEALEELDYQLTIGLRDGEERAPVGTDPKVGDRVARRIRAVLPSNMRLSV